MTEVRRLAEDQELVEGIYTEAVDEFQPNGQAHTTEKFHPLVEREAASIPQRAGGPPQLVFDNKSRVPEQYPARFFFAFDHVPHDAHEVVEQLLFRPSQG